MLENIIEIYALLYAQIGRTALMVASHKGKANAVKLLLSSGAKLGLCDQVGRAT